MKIFVQTQQDYEGGYQVEEYADRDAFIERYSKMSTYERKDIVTIIEGYELEVKPEEVEVVKKWALKSRS